MKRIAVIGCGGAGKSTLARELGRRLGLPVICLDALFWKPGWVQAPDDEFDRAQRELFAGDAWVCDGNYSSWLTLRLERADTIVFLDFPRWRCFQGVFARWIRYWGRVRPDMGPGCPEKVDWEFIQWIWEFPRRARPRIVGPLREFEAAGGRVHVLRTRREVAAFLETV